TCALPIWPVRHRLLGADRHRSRPAAAQLDHRRHRPARLAADRRAADLADRRGPRHRRPGHPAARLGHRRRGRGRLVPGRRGLRAHPGRAGGPAVVGRRERRRRMVAAARARGLTGRLPAHRPGVSGRTAHLSDAMANVEDGDVTRNGGGGEAMVTSAAGVSTAESANGDAASPGWIRRLWAECLRHPGTLAGIGGTLLAGALVEVSAPLLTKRAVDAAGVGDTDVIGTVAILLAVLAVGRFAAAFGRRLLAGRLSLDVQHGLRVRVLLSLQRLDGAGQAALRTGQVVSRSITDLQLVQGLLAMVPLSGMALLQFVLAASVMLWLSPPLALVALLVVPGIGLTVYRMRPRL